MLLNLDSISHSKLFTLPFKYALIPEILSENNLNILLQNMPKNNYYRSQRESGSDKSYNVINNLLLKLGQEKSDLDLYEPWAQLVEDFKSRSYVEALSELLQEDLSSCSLEITLKKYVYGDFISPHTDREDVRATHLIFLNIKWEEAWGGQLCLLKNESDCFTKFLPTIYNTLAFIRSNNSWHSVDHIVEPKAERVGLQVAFWNTANKSPILPGRFEKSIEE